MPDDDLRAMVARVFQKEVPIPPKIDAETLLTQTEALLNGRSAFERALMRGPIEPAEDESRWELRMHQAAFDLLFSASRLFAELLGEAAFRTMYGRDADESSSDKRAALASRLRLFRSLLSRPDWTTTLAELTQEIVDMDGGDIPTVLAREKRYPGQAKQPTRIARLRLHALCWNAHLKAKGIPTSERQAAICQAYKAAWDSVRKWREPCEATLGARGVWEELRYASNQYWGDYEEDNWQPAIRRDGAHYVETWSKQRDGISA
jgi:hypothetical protein